MRCSRCGYWIVDDAKAVDLATGKPVCEECWYIAVTILRRKTA